MLQVKKFTFNPFQENTYVLFDDTKEWAIIDPGCYTPEEKAELFGFIQAEGLKPTLLLNTHCHIDHVLGNQFVFNSYGLSPHIHPQEEVVLNFAASAGKMYGVFLEESPAGITDLLNDELIHFGDSSLKILFTPGHSPGSVCFYNAENKIVIGGDVLFLQSIGRTDLPLGDMDTLMHSIKTQLLTLPDNVIVHAGHGPQTTIGSERKSNPFLAAYL